ncbi:methyltransferase domain-containing protein [Streptomyces tanashiensis]
MPSVPYAWLAQCRPGALILAPLSTGLILLRVRDACARGGPVPRDLRVLRGAPGCRRPAPRAGESGVRPRRGDERFLFLWGLVGGALYRREALSVWLRERRPERERFGVTVSGDRQWAWLDDPGGPYAWPLPGTA